MLLDRLRLHPFGVEAFFDFSLVLTYAFPAEVVAPLLPPGLVADTYEGHAFLAAAVVGVRNLRPAGLPAALGQSFVLTGYRVFVRYRTAAGRNLRGLFILRSDVDSWPMVALGRLTTHYGFRKATTRVERSADALGLDQRAPDARLVVRADLRAPATVPPAGSIFPDLKAARRFAGPLPFTFSPVPTRRAMLLVEGRRLHWEPTPVAVAVEAAEFITHGPLAGQSGRLANAFLLRDVPYAWRPGVLDPLPVAAPDLAAATLPAPVR